MSPWVSQSVNVDQAATTAPETQAARCARAIVRRDFASSRLGRKGVFRRCWQVLRRIIPGTCSPLGVAHLELIHLPSYLVRALGRRGGASIMIDGYEGHAGAVDLTGVEWDEQPLLFQPSLSAQQALQAAARFRLAGPSTVFRNPAPKIDPEVELVGYPYWAYYYERQAGKLDVRLLDAISGNLVGARVKVALLAALASRKQGKDA